jgi:plastocyanin domain-containing protein
MVNIIGKGGIRQNLPLSQVILVELTLPISKVRTYLVGMMTQKFGALLTMNAVIVEQQTSINPINRLNAIKLN